MNQEEARKQAQNDARQGNGPANTRNWDSNSSNAYNAEYERQRREQAKQK